MEHTFNVLAFLLGVSFIVFNRHLARFTRHWQALAYGRDFGPSTRVTYYVGGVVFIFLSLLTW
jgi:hypothetical protein